MPIILERRHRLLHMRASLERKANRGVIKYTLVLLAIPNYVIKKGRPHGHRFGEKEMQKRRNQGSTIAF